MTVLHVPERRHRCLAPPIRDDGSLDIDAYRWDAPGTVRQCECGRVYVAEARELARLFCVSWRPEKRRERRRRERLA